MSFGCFGRVKYSTIEFGNSKYVWNYSYSELSEKLNNLLKGKILNKVYVGLDGYLYGAKRDENYYDFSHMGGTILMVFDDIVLDIFIHAEGMIEHRVHHINDLKVKTTVDFPPSNMSSSENYFYDLKDVFELCFENETVNEIKVDATNTYAFNSKGFDQEKATLAMYMNQLPLNINFSLSNGVEFSLCGDEIEYFYIVLQKEKDITLSD